MPLETLLNRNEGYMNEILEIFFDALGFIATLIIFFIVAIVGLVVLNLPLFIIIFLISLLV